MYWGGQHHNICDLLLNSLEKIYTHALKICIEKKRKYDKMIIVVESRWLLYRGAHCTIMKLFCIFEKFNNKKLGRKVHNLLIGPKPSPPSAFPVSENGAIVCNMWTPENCLSSTPVLGPLSLCPPHGCTMTSSVEWSKTPDQIFTKESILLDLEVRQPPIGWSYKM